MTQPATIATPAVVPVVTNGAAPAAGPPAVAAPPEPAPIDRAQEAVRRAQQESARKQREIGYQKRIAELESDANEYRALRKLAEEDDLVPLMDAMGAKLKVSPDKFVGALRKLQTGDYASEREKKQLQKTVEEAKQAVEDMKSEAAAKEQEVVRQRAVTLLHQAASDAVKYPNVSRLPKAMMQREVEELLIEANEESKKQPGAPEGGVWYSFDDALSFIEKQLSGTSARQEPQQTQQGEQPAASGGTQTPASPRARTITHAMTQESPSGAAKTPLKGKAKIDHLTAVYEAARRK